MGNGADFLAGARYGNNSEYVSIGSPIIINGRRGMIVKRRNDSDTHTNLPKYADTSDMYFRQNKKGVCQGRVYIEHKMCIDFDWSHNHTNDGNGQTFCAGTIHVQVWQWHPDGSFTRISTDARHMTSDEISKYGPLIKAFNPNVKFK